MCFADLQDAEGFKRLDDKLALGLTERLHGELARVIGNLDKDAAKQGRGLRGRQILFMVYSQCSQKTTGAVAYTLHDWLSLKLGVSSRLASFLCVWDSTVASAGVVVTEELKTALFLQEVGGLVEIAEDLAHSRRK